MKPKLLKNGLSLLTAAMVLTGAVAPVHAADKKPNIFGGPAAQFWLRHRQQLFPSTPLLIAGLDQRWWN